MDRVYWPSERPFSKIQQIAIAIKSVPQSGRPNQQHTGILYRDNSGILLLHLAFHLKLKSGPPTLDYVWIDPNTRHRSRLPHLAAKCRQIWIENGREIPFAFSAPNECFDEQRLKFLVGPSKIGLTCATFVLAVFNLVGIKLLQYEEWPSRNDDVEWQRYVIEQLKKAGATSEHVAAVQSFVGAVRVRPEEVGGAATITPHPAEFEATVKRAEELLVVLRNPLE